VCGSSGRPDRPVADRRRHRACSGRASQHGAARSPLPRRIRVWAIHDAVNQSALGAPLRNRAAETPGRRSDRDRPGPRVRGCHRCGVTSVRGAATRPGSGFSAVRGCSLESPTTRWRPLETGLRNTSTVPRAGVRTTPGSTAARARRPKAEQGPLSRLPAVRFGPIPPAR